MKAATGDHVAMDLIELFFVSGCRMGEDIWKWILRKFWFDFVLKCSDLNEWRATSHSVRINCALMEAVWDTKSKGKIALLIYLMGLMFLFLKNQKQKQKHVASLFYKNKLIID